MLFVEVRKIENKETVYINPNYIVKIESVATKDEKACPELSSEVSSGVYRKGDEWFRAKITLTTGEIVITEDDFTDVIEAIEAEYEDR